MSNLIEIATYLFLALRNCALEKDLELWEAGDLTEVGEEGLTLRCAVVITNAGGILRSEPH